MLIKIGLVGVRWVRHAPVFAWATPCGNLCPNVVQTNLKIGSRLKLQSVEMEALTAVQVALLTIYDMCKAVDRGMVMGDIKLLEKSGGKSGEWATT